MSPEVAVQGPREGVILGKYAKFDALQENQSVSELPLTDQSGTESEEKVAGIRARRWARKAALRDLLFDVRKRRGLKPSLAKRLVNCYRLRRRQADGKQVDEVQVRQSKLSRALYYAGLQSCGSPWACPLCAAKIAERRCEELQQAVDLWLSMGNTVVLVALTNSHGPDDLLGDLMDGQADAIRYFFMDRQVRKSLQLAHVVGHVRAWEVTHGRYAYGNGWHPHFHLLLFVDVQAARKHFGRGDDEGWSFSETFFADLLRGPLALPWLRACQKAGLGEPSAERGVRVDHDRGGGSATYPAKMGLGQEAPRRWHFADELTRGQTKKAANGKGETFFEIVDALLEEPDNEDHERLILEYIGATTGRSQVRWSPGLRDRLGMGEAATDEEIAAEVREDDPIWAKLSQDQWRLILRNKAEWQVLRTGETQGLDGVLALLHGLEVNHV